MRNLVTLSCLIFYSSVFLLDFGKIILGHKLSEN